MTPGALVHGDRSRRSVRVRPDGTVQAPTGPTTQPRARCPALETQGHHTRQERGKQDHPSTCRGPGPPWSRKDTTDGFHTTAGIHLHSGELHAHATDLAVAGRGFDFAWTRHYRSREWRSTSMGVGWTHSYERRVVPDPAAPGSLLVHAGDSRIDSFAPDGTGLITTEPAPILAPSPTVIGPRIVAPVPTTTPLPIVG